MKLRVRMAIGGLALAVAAAGMFTSTGSSASSPTGATPFTLSATGAASGAKRRTFMSLLPACACSRKTVIEQFSMRTGKQQRAIATVTGGPQQVSNPEADRTGRLWLTMTSGPIYLGHVAGGAPQPNTCSGDLVRFDPASRVSRTVLSFPRSELVGSAIPSPSGAQVALLTGGCSTSFFNEHIVVQDLRTGTQIQIGADAAPCHALFNVAWSSDGSKLVFPYGPSVLPRTTTFVPAGTCRAPEWNRLVVVSARRTSQSSSWQPIKGPRRCSYEAAAFDQAGIAAIEGCTTGTPRNRPGGPEAGNAYLVQLTARGKLKTRLPLARGFNAGDIVEDPQTGTVLVSEYQGANQGIKVYDWVWSFDGRVLRTVGRYPNRDAATVIAEPW